MSYVCFYVLNVIYQVFLVHVDMPILMHTPDHVYVENFSVRKV